MNKIGKGVLAANFTFEPVPLAITNFQASVRGRALLMRAGAHQLGRLIPLQIRKQVPLFGAVNLLLVDAGHGIHLLPSADTGHMVVDDLVKVPEKTVQKILEGGGIALQIQKFLPEMHTEHAMQNPQKLKHPVILLFLL